MSPIKQITFAHSEPPPALITCAIDPNGQITSLFNVVADPKITHISFWFSVFRTGRVHRESVQTQTRDTK